MSESNLNQWKDDEYGYCANLVAQNGTRNVPRESVDYYLRVQESSASMEGQPGVAAALLKLRNEWQTKLTALTAAARPRTRYARLDDAVRTAEAARALNEAGF